MSGKTVVIVGTGTGVGKTHVTRALLRALGARGLAWKPIESGVGAGSSDSELLREAGAAAPALYSFREPISPHLAARREGVELDRARIRAEAARLGETSEVLLLETAGGLFSPLGLDFTNADLVLGLSPSRVLLVAPDRLGVLHDVGATLRAARAAGLGIDALVLSVPEHPDASTGSNRVELAHVLEVAALFERSAFDSAETQRAARETLVAIRC